MNLSTKQTLLIVLFLVLAVLGGYYFLFDMIKAKNKQVSLFYQEIDLYSQRESMRRTTEKTAEELSEKIQKLDSYFLHKDDVVPFIESIEKAGKKSGVEASIVSVGVSGAPEMVESSGTSSGGVVQDKNSEVLALRLDVKGTWSDVLSFVSYIENLPYKVSIGGVVFHRNSSVPLFFNTENNSSAQGLEKNNAIVWTATMEMKVLTLK